MHLLSPSLTPDDRNREVEHDRETLPSAWAIGCQHGREHPARRLRRIQNEPRGDYAGDRRRVVEHGRGVSGLRPVQLPLGSGRLCQNRRLRRPGHVPPRLQCLGDGVLSPVLDELERQCQRSSGALHVLRHPRMPEHVHGCGHGHRWQWRTSGHRRDDLGTGGQTTSSGGTTSAPTNLILDPNFNAVSAYWSATANSGEAATLSCSGGQCCVTNEYSTWFAFSLGYPRSSLQAFTVQGGATYTLSFRASGSSVNTLEVKVGKAVSPTRRSTPGW